MKKSLSITMITLALPLLFNGCSDKEDKRKTTNTEIKKIQKSEPIKAKPNKMPTWEKYQ